MYWKLIWVSFRAQLQYRWSFLMMVIGNFLSAFIEYLGVWAFFTRFGTLGHWTLYDVGVFYGIGHIAFALCEAFSRGFDVFHNHVRNGDFDRTLLRPRGTVLQILGSECQLMRIGRLMEGTLILVWSMRGLGLSWGLSHWLLLAWAILGGALMFTGVIILQATSTFWTIQSLEIWNILTYGGVTTLQYPIDIYKGTIRWLFTYVLPLAAINYWPCSYLLGKGYCPVWWSFAAPGLGVAMLGLGLLVWRIGVAHYHSTGS